MKRESKLETGIGLLVVNDAGQILLSERKGSHGAGEFAGPGGGNEPGERYIDTARRELAEEVGEEFVVARSMLQLCRNRLEYGARQFNNIGILARHISGDPKRMEPEKAGEWGWYALDDLPTPLFGCVDSYIAEYSRLNLRG